MIKDDQILNDAYVNFGLLKENSYLNRAFVLLSAKHSDIDIAELMLKGIFTQ